MNWWVLKRKVHPSWLISFGCLAFFIGVFLAKYQTFNFLYNFQTILISIILLIIVFSRRFIYLIPLIIIAGFLLGICRGSVIQIDINKYDKYFDKNIIVSGTVKDDVDTDSSGQIIIRLKNIMIGNKNMPGILYVKSQNQKINRGDNILIEGFLNKGFGNFVASVKNANIKKITKPKPGDIARVVRDDFATAIKKVIPEPASSLGIGFLLGQRRSLPTDLILALQIVGLTHIVVASGYNLTILVRLARRLFAKLSKYLSALISILLIISFIAITGISPSMSRAGLVSILSLMAWYYGRKFHPIILLSIAIMVTVAINPSYAWGDLGWQLSFAAFAGVMILSPLLQNYLFGSEKPNFILQVIVETVSAQITTAPIIILAFGQFSNIAILANLLILPFIPFTMLFVFIAGLSYLIVPFLANIISLPAIWLLDYMIKIIDFMSGIEWARSEININTLFVAIYYFVVISICIYIWKVTKTELRDFNLLE